MTSFSLVAINEFVSLTVLRLYLMILLYKLVPAGQIGLQQHVRGVGRRGRQVGEQQRHLEVLTRTTLQDPGDVGSISPTAVGQLVKLWMGGGEDVRACGPSQRQRERES